MNMLEDNWYTRDKYYLKNTHKKDKADTVCK